MYIAQCFSVNYRNLPERNETPKITEIITRQKKFPSLTPLLSSVTPILSPPSFLLFIFPSLPLDFYPTHRLRARAALYPETVTARMSSQRPITTSGPSSWTPSASQPGPAWDAGAGGEFWWTRGPGRATRDQGAEVTGAGPRDCTCGWWRWWSTRSYSPARWTATGCAPRANCASTHSPMNPPFWKDFSKTSQGPTDLFPLSWRSVAMDTALICWRSSRRTWASRLTSTLSATGSTAGLKTVAGRDSWAICSAARPT